VGQKVECGEINMALAILRTAGVVRLIEEDKVGGMRMQYYINSVVQPTKTLKALEKQGISR
jgi:hypothetical protein